MQHIIVVRDVVGAAPYWAADYTLPEVRARFKRLSGKFPSSKASVVLLYGEHAEDYTINDLGDLGYHKDVKLIKLQ